MKKLWKTVKGGDDLKQFKEAVCSGYVTAVRKHLENGVDVNHVFENGWTALICASGYGHKETVRYLLESGATVDKQSNKGVTALMKASENGHKDIVKLGDTALHFASMYGHTDTVTFLVESNAKIDIKDKCGRTALDWAIEENHEDIVKLLRDLKAEMDKARKHDGFPTLTSENEDVKPDAEALPKLPRQPKPKPTPPTKPKSKSDNTSKIFPPVPLPKNPGETTGAVPKIPSNLLRQPKSLPPTKPKSKSDNTFKKAPPVPLLKNQRKGASGEKMDRTVPASPGIGLTMINSEDVKIGSVLGAGGFGTVYRAKHINWGRVAVKRLQNVTLTESFRKEAEKMLRSLTSPYLVRIMGLIKKPDGVDIVMEFFENGSLKEFEEKYMKCYCWARKIKMIQDIACGMNFLHTLNPPIIHRDLKLENVFVGDGFKAKIGDFGLAVSSTKSRMDAGSAGTVSHMPPEAFDVEGTPDEAWDIYTFGITTYELTTGRDPWPQQKTHANERLIAIWVGNGHRPNLEVVPKDAPVEIIDMIKSCWAPISKERPQFIDVLETVTELFETKHEKNLRRADRAISEQMDIVQEASERGSTSVDSGWGSLEACSLQEN